jgi:hypothetical protein
LRLRARGEASKLEWVWNAGSATTAADFGNPLSTDDYTLCVFDGTQPAPHLLFSASAPTGSTCGAKPCWRAVGDPTGRAGFAYRGRSPFSSGGLSRMRLRPGRSGRAKIAVQGRGSNLALPSPLLVAPPVTVQMQAGSGQCWEATYVTPQTQSSVYQARGTD